MKGFLPDATDFTDMVRKELPSVRFPHLKDQNVECPVCHGYGGWNLELNAYPGSTPEQRHFRAFCHQCWGWGYVKPGPDAECVHEFVEIAPDQPFRRWHTIRCTRCGVVRSYDSSD